MKNQSFYDVIFSNGRSYRWKRHLLFWLLIYFYHLVRIGIMLPTLNNRHALFSLSATAFYWGILPNLLFSYTLVYFLIPKYFNAKRYISFAAGILMLIALEETFVIFFNMLSFNTPVYNAIGHGTRLLDVFDYYRPGIIRSFGNPPLIFGLFVSIKMLKSWHLEQLKTETLALENALAEMQLLKAQVHPHFLFNTLNNIYSFTLSQSSQAGPLVQKLSDMLEYMIRECEQPLVLLEREIKLIQDYMGLEKVRYGNRLDMQVEIEGNYENKLIAPLLLIPFVENSFKHGASKLPGIQWIKIFIRVQNDKLDFRLTNTKPNQSQVLFNKTGIGLVNVKKRLELLYPEKHVLEIRSTEYIYEVRLELIFQKETFNEKINKSLLTEAVYA